MKARCSRYGPSHSCRHPASALPHRPIVAAERRRSAVVSLLVALAFSGLLIACGGEEATPPSASEPPAGAPSGVVAEEIFTNRASEVGVEFNHFNGMTGDYYTAEVTATGAGVLDYDNDGDLDLYLVQGRILNPEKDLSHATFPPADGDLPLIDRLYRNDLEILADGTRRLSFTDVTAASGIESTGYGMGITTGDYDNDGWIDIYVTNLRDNLLLRNNGDGTFSDTTSAAGAQDDRWSVPASFVDYDHDGRLDLLVANYVDFEFDDEKTCFRVTGSRDYCGPLAYKEVSDRLFHNEGDGRFRDSTREAGINTAFGSALGIVILDVDHDGWLDLYVANDGRANQLWINQRDGTFVDEALLRGAAVNAEGFAEASMGVVAGDFRNSGAEDLFMAHLLGETNTFYVNDGSGMFEDSSIRAGLATPSKWATAFGAATLDFDNDGWLDIMTANGEVRVIEEQARKGLEFPLAQPNQLYHNLGNGRFEEITERAGATFQDLQVSRGAAIGDLDNDGDTDILLLNNNGPAEVLINNVGAASSWVGLRLIGDSVERDMLGAWVRLHRASGTDLWRRVRTDGSFASASDPRVLFGLGDRPDFDHIEVLWPSGRRERWTGIEAGRYTTIREGSGEPIS